ncbi:hypothetical protein [Idiomarina abyssalis]|uniref:hypothetical protein n=1 Tax=Idiomarina abyssalis TaxID=86102 RepID=UPI003A8CEB10
MEYGIENAKMIDTGRVFLDLSNPRHEPFSDQDDAITYLCNEEQVLNLAKDIAKIGLNPLELFALIQEEGDTYFSAEGNRRLCALKLLNDPELAPANVRNEFKKAAEHWTPVEKIFCVVFSNRDEVRTWLDRIHAGSDEGRGRRQWKAEQKSRNSIYSKNDLALEVLDYAENKGLINSEDRKGRLSTVQRYLGNPLMRDALGLESKAGEPLTTSLNENDLTIMLKSFMKDLANKDINTRDNSQNIQDYSNKLRQLDGLDGTRGDKRPLNGEPDEDKKPNDESRKNPKSPKLAKIPPSDELQSALHKIPSYKLEKIYYSMCSLTLNNHTPLLYVGAWSFIETLTALCGRDGASFESFLSVQKLTNLGLGNKSDTKAIRQAITRISEFGNVTKHNKTSAGFNGEQLANDVQLLEPLFKKLASEASASD